jgi:hypothetical protein
MCSASRRRSRRDAPSRVGSLSPDSRRPKREALGYRFDFKDRSIAFSGDSAPSEAVAKIANGADVLVHEAMYVPAIETYTRTAAGSISRMGDVRGNAPPLSYGDHLLNTDLPPPSSTAVNPAAVPTVDRSASAAEPLRRITSLVSGCAEHPHLGFRDRAHSPI